MYCFFDELGRLDEYKESANFSITGLDKIGFLFRQIGFNLNYLVHFGVPEL